MKVVLVLALVIAAVYAEDCLGGHDQCSITICPTGAELHCVDGLCTCTTAAVGTDTCTNKFDCHGGCSHGRPHCINGNCRCAH